MNIETLALASESTQFSSGLWCFADISEIESYRSYSPQDDRRGHHSDLSSHSSNERIRDKPRYAAVDVSFSFFLPVALVGISAAHRNALALVTNEQKIEADQLRLKPFICRRQDL